VLCFSYKWLDEKAVHVCALPDYPSYKKNPKCDRALMGDLWELLDAADLVVAHNGDRFDIRRSNARFVTHRFIPPDPYKTIDTLKIARKHFKFDSNRLDALGHYLKVGRKCPTMGKDTWIGCMNGNRMHWSILKKYAAQDTLLLERVYLKLRPWTVTHPNLSFYTNRCECPVCQSARVIAKGRSYLNSGWKQRYRCNSCGHRFVAGRISRHEDTSGDRRKALLPPPL
jgi:hypothetical protein